MTFKEYEQEVTMIRFRMAVEEKKLDELSDTMAKQFGLPVRGDKFRFEKNIKEGNYRTLSR